MSADTPITLQAVVVQSANLMSSVIDDDVVMLDVERGVYYGVTNVASRIWQLIEQPRRLSDVRDVLLQEYDIDSETCTQQVLDFLRELHSKDLVSVQTTAASDEA